MRTAIHPIQAPALRGWLAALTLATVLAVSGCGGGVPVEPLDPTASPSPSAAVVVIPEDGVRLRAFGYANGPTGEFSLPRSAAITATVDQPNNVTVVITAPPATEVYGYLLRALPLAGFTVDAQDAAATTLTFTGHGWRGSFTGDARTCAVLLRPV